MLKQNNEKMTDCPICCEDFTTKARAPIVCGHCDFTACKQCVRKFSVNPDSFDEPHCMSCKGKWDRSFFKSAVNNSWFNGNHGYKQHMKDGLFNVEQARFPETMEAVSNYVRIPEMRKENEELNREIRELENKALVLRQKVQLNKRNASNFLYGMPEINADYKPKKEKKVFIHRCPAEGCLGFLSSSWKCGICSVWACSKCGEIKGHTSKDVTKEQLDEQHVCKQENIDSMNMIKKETRPCPDCAVPIFKVSGCDQMWCTQCHIAFSWNTGCKVNGVIHNPHFYAWARENNTNARRVVGEVACGGLPYRETFMARVNSFTTAICPIGASNRRRFSIENIKKIRKTFNYQEMMKKYGFEMGLQTISSELFYTSNYNIGEIRGPLHYQFQLNNIYKFLLIDFLINPDEYYRHLTHFRAVELDGLRREAQRQEDNKMLRIKYLAKEMTKKDFETKLLTIDKKKRKRTALLELFELVNTVYTETFIDTINLMENWKMYIVKDDKKNHNFENKIMGIINNFKRIVKIVVYANKQLRKLSSEFGLCVPHICFNLSMYRGSWKSSVRTKKAKYFDVIDDPEDTINFKNHIALKCIESFLNMGNPHSSPVRHIKQIINVLKNNYGYFKTHFNINTLVTIQMAADKFTAPIPIVILKLFEKYFSKKWDRLLPNMVALNHSKNKLILNIKEECLIDNNNIKHMNEKQILSDMYDFYSYAWKHYQKFMKIANSKKLPFNRNIQCSNGYTIKWYESIVFPNIIV